MGACASVPKTMQGDFARAPPPEPPKEDTFDATTTTEVPEVIKVTEKDVVVVMEDVESQSSAEGENDEDDLPLGSSVDTNEEVQDKADVETKTVIVEKLKTYKHEYDNPLDKDLSYIAPVARVSAEDDRDIEVKEEI